MRTLSDKLEQTRREFQKEAPRLVRSMTNDAATFFKTDVFNNQGVDVQPSGRWANRKRETKKTSGKKVLVSTGTLRRSITANSRGNVGIVSTAVPYGQYHMTGTDKMPQRKFMGESDILNRKFKVKILRFLNKVFNV